MKGQNKSSTIWLLSSANHYATLHSRTQLCSRPQEEISNNTVIKMIINTAGEEEGEQGMEDNTTRCRGVRRQVHLHFNQTSIFCSYQKQIVAFSEGNRYMHQSFRDRLFRMMWCYHFFWFLWWSWPVREVQEMTDRVTDTVFILSNMGIL